MAARIAEIRDAAVAVIEAAAVATVISGTTADVSAVAQLAVDPDEMTATVRQVQVRAAGYADGGPVTRGIDATDYRIQIAVVEVYTGAGDVPVSWLDDRLEWFDSCVVRALGDARDRLSGAYALSLDDVEIDEEQLTDKWLVWLQAGVTLRDERAV